MRPLLAAALALAAPLAAQTPDRFGDAPLDRPEADLAASVAAPPASFAFQGVLEDGGQPVPDGTYGVQIRLYGVSTGGTALYIEDHSAATEAGAFALSVGAGTPVVGAFGDVNFSEAVWVEVVWAGTVLAPRTEIEPAPVARTLQASATVESDVGGLVPEPWALRGLNTSPSGFAYGVQGASESTSGTGVFGWAPAPSGPTTGVLGRSDSPSGVGVSGFAQASSGDGHGVSGLSNGPSGRGVYGRASSSTGTTYGVYGESASASGRGVQGATTAASGTTYGVIGLSASTGGFGVYGDATAASGATYGAVGRSASTGGFGVYGEASAASGTTYGVVGESASTSGRGVYGWATANSGATIGGFFESESDQGRGVYGSATATSGLTRGVDGRSASTGGRGVYGEASAATGTTIGVLGASVSNSGRGVVGSATSATGYTFGVRGEVNSPNGYAGYFVGGQGVYTDGAYLGGGADLAEFFPLAPAASVAPGDLVGLRGGAVSLATSGAEQVMVASTDPAFVGNPDAEAGGALVALVGQAEVRLSGPASAGDLLVASGRDDGTARAVAPEAYDPAADGPVAGRVLSVPEAGRVVALVGVDEAAALRAVVAAQAARLDAQQAQIGAQAREAETLRSDLDAVLARLGIAGRSTGSASARASTR